MLFSLIFFFFFFNDTATTEIYTLSLHDALPIWPDSYPEFRATSYMFPKRLNRHNWRVCRELTGHIMTRSEEHTSELQSPDHLVCRLLLEKKKKYENIQT